MYMPSNNRSRSRVGTEIQGREILIASTIDARSPLLPPSYLLPHVVSQSNSASIKRWVKERVNTSDSHADFGLRHIRLKVGEIVLAGGTLGTIALDTSSIQYLWSWPRWLSRVPAVVIPRGKSNSSQYASACSVVRYASPSVDV